MDARYCKHVQIIPRFAMIGQIPRLITSPKPLPIAKMLLTLQTKINPRSESHITLTVSVFIKNNNSLSEDLLALSAQLGDVLDLLPIGYEYRARKAGQSAPSAFEPDSRDVTNTLAYTARLKPRPRAPL